ncbi:hypothetical protein [Pseudorhodoferax sp. Leaf265]|uniref:hypothetical protein n=1 Tax=Pseudorhodoferax sp. Leaf265 TaxID=1736315 RepID=UPI0012E91CB3|nr:hypothetical protein [Pseudorhodoferax sp. Leaf265]
MSTVTPTQVSNLLANSPDKNVSKLAKDTELTAALVRVFAATLEIAKDFPQTKAQLAHSLTKKAYSVSKVAATASASDGLKLTNFAAAQTLKSIGLLKVAGMSPAKASAYITLTMAEKVVAAAGLGQLDKCKMAIASLTITTAMAPLSCVGAPVLGCVIGGLAVASEALNVYGQCGQP